VPIRYRIDRHDRSQLELKLDYPLREGVSEQSYSVETFLFVPRILGLSKYNYKSDDFYGQSTSFLRMTTPQRRLADLSDKSAVKPWTGDLKKELAEYLGGGTETLEVAERNLRLLGCVYKRALGNAREDLRSTLERLKTERRSELVNESLDAFILDLQGARKRLRKIGSKLDEESLPPSLIESWHAIDEYISLLTEEACTQALIQVDSFEPSEGLETRKDSLKKIAVSEYKHRRSKGWGTYASEESNNEYLAHRWRILKRFVSGVLYVDVDRQDTGLLTRDIAGMVAAAFAMLVATLALLFINHNWPANLSWAFVTAMVASYVVKDRVKEWGRKRLGERLSRNAADHLLKIRSPVSGNLLGSCTARRWWSSLWDFSRQH